MAGTHFGHDGALLIIAAQGFVLLAGEQATFGLHQYLGVQAAAVVVVAIVAAAFYLFSGAVLQLQANLIAAFHMPDHLHRAQHAHAALLADARQCFDDGAIAADVAERGQLVFFAVDQGAAKMATARNVNLVDFGRANRPCAQAFQNLAAAIRECNRARVVAGLRQRFAVDHAYLSRRNALPHQQRGQCQPDRACTANGYLSAIGHVCPVASAIGCRCRFCDVRFCKVLHCIHYVVFHARP